MASGIKNLEGMAGKLVGVDTPARRVTSGRPKTRLTTRRLETFGFATPLGHLDQAIEAHTRGGWVACKGQLRTFVGRLFDDITRNVRPQAASQRPSSENRRALLAEIGFLATDRNEWTHDGKNYVNGPFEMHHTESSQPGVSDEEHSTFRLHVVLGTARTFLRRLINGQ